MANLSLTFGSYAIPNVNRIKSNFGEIDNKLIRLARTSGGFDPSGSKAKPLKPGMIEARFTIIASDQDTMQAAVDAIHALVWAGDATLTYQPQGSLGARHCTAHIDTIDIPYSAGDGLVFVPGKIIFQVASPFWLAAAATVTTKALSGTNTTWTLAYADGNYTAIPTEVKITTAVGETIENPVIKRLNAAGGSVIWDQLAWVGTLGASENITVNPQKKSVLVNSVTGLSAFTWLSPDWFRLDPGNNYLSIDAENVGDAATLSITYWKTYIG
jgi:hypothetical protein